MFRNAIFALGLLTAFVAPAAATGLEAVQTVERAVVTVDENGARQTAFEPATQIAPGDELRYSLAYNNTGDQSALELNLVMPVPAEVDLIAGSAETDLAVVSYSVDQGVTFGALEELTVMDADVAREATAKDVTHVRWTMLGAVEPEATGTLSFRGVLQ